MLFSKNRYFGCGRYAITSIASHIYDRVTSYILIKGVIYDVEVLNGALIVNNEECANYTDTPYYFGYMQDYDSVVVSFSNRLLEFTGKGCCAYRDIAKRGMREFITHGYPIGSREYNAVEERRSVYL